MKTYSIPRHIWRAIYPVLIFFVLSVVVTFAAMVVIAFAVIIADGTTEGSALSQSVMQDGSLFESFTSGFSGNPELADMVSRIEGAVFGNTMWLQLLTNVVQIAVLLPLFHFTRLASPRYGGGKFRPSHVVLVVLAAMGMSLTLSYIFGMFDITSFFPEYESLMSIIEDAPFLPQVLAVGIAGPVAEELCFRGLVHTRLAQWLPGWAAALISGVLFGLIHLNVLQGAYAFVFGFCLSLVYMKYKTIWAPIAGHIGFNIISVLLDGFMTATGIVIPDAAILVPSVLLAAVCAFMIAKVVSVENQPGGDERRERFNALSTTDGADLKRNNYTARNDVAEPENLHEEGDLNQ